MYETLNRKDKVVAKKTRNGQTMMYKTLHRKDNVVAKKTRNGQTMMYKTLHRKDNVVALATTLSFLLRFTEFDYPFSIFKLFNIFFKMFMKR
jgi:hypothetical protein